MQRYKIRSAKDLKILYSAEMTKSVILVTGDKDFDHIEGLDIMILDMIKYLYEMEFTGKDIEKE